LVAGRVAKFPALLQFCDGGKPIPATNALAAGGALGFAIVFLTLTGCAAVLDFGAGLCTRAP
jgi:hypothetical protein